MSKKKSLGSSPIGFHSENSTLGFIPDLGVSQSQDNTNTSHGNGNNREHNVINSRDSIRKSKKPKKKIVSYNLDVVLISQVKSIANDRDMYYSELVGKALKKWITENG